MPSGSPEGGAEAAGVDCRGAAHLVLCEPRRLSPRPRRPRPRLHPRPCPPLAEGVLAPAVVPATGGEGGDRGLKWRLFTSSWVPGSPSASTASCLSGPSCSSSSSTLLSPVNSGGLLRGAAGGCWGAGGAPGFAGQCPFSPPRPAPSCLLLLLLRVRGAVEGEVTLGSLSPGVLNGCSACNSREMGLGGGVGAEGLRGGAQGANDHGPCTPHLILHHSRPVLLLHLHHVEEVEEVARTAGPLWSSPGARGPLTGGLEFSRKIHMAGPQRGRSRKQLTILGPKNPFGVPKGPSQMAKGYQPPAGARRRPQ